MAQTHHQRLRASSYQLLDFCESDQLANAASGMSCLGCSRRHECQDKLTDPELSVLHVFSPILLAARLCYSFSSYSHAVDEVR